MGQIDRNNVPTYHVELGEREGEKEGLMIEGQASRTGRGGGLEEKKEGECRTPLRNV